MRLALCISDGFSGMEPVILQNTRYRCEAAPIAWCSIDTE